MMQILVDPAIIINSNAGGLEVKYGLIQGFRCYCGLSWMRMMVGGQILYENDKGGQILDENDGGGTNPVSEAEQEPISGRKLSSRLDLLSRLPLVSMTF